VINIMPTKTWDLMRDGTNMTNNQIALSESPDWQKPREATDASQLQLDFYALRASMKSCQET
jgi:hypothetical protein